MTYLAESLLSVALQSWVPVISLAELVVNHLQLRLAVAEVELESRTSYSSSYSRTPWQLPGSSCSCWCP
eukprot:8052439-Pyramimonas_sp.AAC.1